MLQLTFTDIDALLYEFLHYLTSGGESSTLLTFILLIVFVS